MHEQQGKRRLITVQVDESLVEEFRRAIKADDPDATLSTEIRRYMRWRIKRTATPRRRRQSDPPALRQDDKPPTMPRSHWTTAHVQNEDEAPRHGRPVSPTESRGGSPDAPHSTRAA